MKLKGRKDLTPSVETVVLPREDYQEGDEWVSGDLVFKCGPVKSMKEFETLCPLPSAPKSTRPGGEVVEKTDAPEYVLAVEEHGKKRLAYMILKSMGHTPDLEWEKVKMEQPNTWMYYETELRESGLTDLEINRIVIGVMRANALDEGYIEAARMRFLELESGRSTVERS